MSSEYGSTDSGLARKAVKESDKGLKPVVCQARMYGKPCKFCTEALNLRRSDDEEDEKKYADIRAKPTYYMAVYDLEDAAAGRQIYGCNITNWKFMCDILPDDRDDADAGVDFTNIKSPHPIIITRKGSGRNTKYTLHVSPKPYRFPPQLVAKPPLDLDNILEILESDDVEIWSPKTGKKSKILVFPPWNSNGLFFKEVYYHWGTEQLANSEDGNSEFDGDASWKEDFETGPPDEYSGEFDDDFEGGTEKPPDLDAEKTSGVEEQSFVEGPVDFLSMTPKNLRDFAEEQELDIPEFDKLRGRELRQAVKKAWNDQL